MASTTQTTSTSLPDWVQPYAQSYLDRASQVADQPYQQYTGQQVAGLNGTQMTAMDAIQNRAMNGNPYMNTAQQSLQGIAGGQNLGAQAAQNPYLTATNGQASAQNPYLNAFNQAQGAQNPYLNAQNPLAQGENPYLQQQIDAASSDALRNYNTAIRPQMDAAMAQSGSFGNSGLQQVQAQQQTDLGRQLGNISSGMRMQDYTTRQGLQENAVNRQFQGGQQLQQNLYNSGAQQAQNQFTGGQQLQQNAYNAGSQMQNQLFTGGQAQASAQNNMFQNQQAQQMQALSMAPQFAQADYTDANAMMNVGNTLQQQQQNQNNADYQNWQNAQNWNKNQTQFLGNALGFNFGQNSTQTQNQPSGSKLGSAVGGALAGYGATGSGWGALAGGVAGLLGN